jgi:glucose/arabinose dehydrogenase
MRSTFAAALLLPLLAAAQESSALRTVNALGSLTFTQPTGVASIPGDKTRLFVIEKTGNIVMVQGLTGAHPSKKTVLSLAAPRDGALETTGECGVLGLDFHPRFSENGFFFVFYSLRVNGQLQQRLSRFKMERGDLAETSKEQPLVSQADPAPYHNGGDVHFGPDGYLYFSTGDGGAGAQNHAPFIDRGFFSSIYRIDVDKRRGNLRPNPDPAVGEEGAGNPAYLVPADNPFVKTNGYRGAPVNRSTLRTETWASGLRNPWRFSYDFVSQRWFAGDVGDRKYEEIDILVAGGDYGWNTREGLHEAEGWHDLHHNLKPGFVDPIHEYDHAFGICVIGGVVYRGATFPQLAGAYLFGDTGRGQICALKEKGGRWERETIAREPGVVGFGVNPADGEPLIVSLPSGRIKKLAR